MKLKHLFENKNNILSRVNDAIKSKTRDSELEKRIIQVENPNIATRYAQHVIGGRWPEAEHFIKLFTDNAYQYAHWVIKDRWPEVEPKIMKDPYYAYFYAKDVIKGRWPEAEPFILNQPVTAINYAGYVIKGKWKELEAKMDEDDYYESYYNYYLRLVPSARTLSKDDCLTLGRLQICDVPNTITDEQTKRMLSLLFPSVILEDIDSLLVHRVYDITRLPSQYLKTEPFIKTTLKHIKENNYTFLHLVKAVDPNASLIHDLQSRQTDFE